MLGGSFFLLRSPQRPLSRTSGEKQASPHSSLFPLFFFPISVVLSISDFLLHFFLKKPLQRRGGNLIFGGKFAFQNELIG